MLIIAITTIAGALLCLLVALGLISATDKKARDRLAGLVPAVDATEGRNVKVDASAVGARRFLTTPGLLRRLEKNLALAGHPPAWTVQKLLIVKLMLPVAVFMIVRILAFGDGPRLFDLMAVIAVVVAYFVPDLLIYSRATERQEAIQLELPDTLDKLTISVESGLGFEAALARAAHSGRGPLADELMRTVQDTRLGVSRRDAYIALSDRTKVDDLKKFLRAIIQADEYGVSISAAVRSQADEMRVKRRLRAEGKAAQVAVKLLFPLMACVFPVIFIVVLAPAVLNAMATL